MIGESGPGLARISLLRENPSIRYAGEELAKYLRLMCGVDCDVRLAPDPAAEEPTGVEFGLYEDFGLRAPLSDAPDLDAAVHVDVVEGCGVIAGRNSGSVLLGVYRFLAAAGCGWVRPDRTEM